MRSKLRELIGLIGEAYPIIIKSPGSSPVGGSKRTTTTRDARGAGKDLGAKRGGVEELEADQKRKDERRRDPRREDS